MTVALNDLRLDALYVAYPGETRYAIDERIVAVPAGTPFSDSGGATVFPGRVDQPSAARRPPSLIGWRRAAKVVFGNAGRRLRVNYLRESCHATAKKAPRETWRTETS